jgi:hypothetical protein
MTIVLVVVRQHRALKDKNSSMMTVNATASNPKTAHVTNILTIKLVNACACPKNAVKTSILIQETVSAIAQSQKEKMRALTTTTGVPLPVHASAIHLHLTAMLSLSLIARFAPAFAEI